jgi:hypothetical protein
MLFYKVVLNPFLIHMRLEEGIEGLSCWTLPCLVVFYLIHIYQTIRGYLKAEERLQHPAVWSLAWRITVTSWPTRLYLWEMLMLRGIHFLMQNVVVLILNTGFFVGIWMFHFIQQVCVSHKFQFNSYSFTRPFNSPKGQLQSEKE